MSLRADTTNSSQRLVEEAKPFIILDSYPLETGYRKSSLGMGFHS